MAGTVRHVPTLAVVDLNMVQNGNGRGSRGLAMQPVGVAKVGGFFVHKRENGRRTENRPLWNGGPMSSSPSSPEKRDEVEDLAQAIREAIDDEISELAANLASTDDAHLFGDNEFKIRALAHKIAAKAIQQHLSQKKTDTEAPA